MGEKTIGRVAYEAYCEKTGWRSLATGQPLPQWVGLAPEICVAWEAAGEAVRELFCTATVEAVDQPING
jgi:hypothetical protein